MELKYIFDSTGCTAYGRVLSTFYQLYREIVMKGSRKLGIVIIIIAVIIAIFGIWLKTYNDKIAQTQVNETGTFYLPDGTCLHTTSDSMMYFAFTMAVIIAVIGVYIFLHKKEPRKIVVKKQVVEKERPKEAPKTLGPEMRKIFDIITQDGAILQGELVTKSGMDKVKV